VNWHLAVDDDEDERVVGAFIVFPASEYVLELRDNGLDNTSRREWCNKLVAVLNEARKAGKL